MDPQYAFEPDLVLEPIDQAHLSAITSMPGYQVLHRVFRAEVDKFVVALINADIGDDHDILARHRLAKAAAQFYTGVTSRINECVLQYRAGVHSDPTPVDVTENILDLGDVEHITQSLPNLFEEGDFLNEH